MPRYPEFEPGLSTALREGMVIPAHPLALTENDTLDEQRQRALTRYYLAAGAGGLAVGVHSTQFKIHDPSVGLYEPVLTLAAETAREIGGTPIMVAGICGKTRQATKEAQLAKALGYHLGLLSLRDFPNAKTDELLAHARRVAEVIPLIGFYLQSAVGGAKLSPRFWRELSEIPNLTAIKMAPFDRYKTLDVVRAVAESSRRDRIALYTGNDDNIILDLLTPFEVEVSGKSVSMRIVGGLLGQWACWTRRAVKMLDEIKAIRTKETLPARWLTLAAQLTEANAAIFDAANDFRGCVPGISYVLQRQGLLANCRTLDPEERLSPGQTDKIDAVTAAYPHLTDGNFIRNHLNDYLR